jgi:hypothetical protein
MGISRDISECEIEFVKEMAEGLGNTGVILDNLLTKAHDARSMAMELMHTYQIDPGNASTKLVINLNKHIREYNALVDKAEDALRWLLIQREACGFRIHKNVNLHYPIPSKLTPVKK